MRREVAAGVGVGRLERPDLLRVLRVAAFFTTYCRLKQVGGAGWVGAGGWVRVCIRMCLQFAGKAMHVMQGESAWTPHWSPREIRARKGPWRSTRGGSPRDFAPNIATLDG